MRFLQRKIYSELKNHLDKPEISLILGPRQAGKTTLMQKLKDDLEKEGEKSVYFNLDIKRDAESFGTQHTLLRKIESLVGKNPGIVFIDEVQRLKNAGLFLKGFFDMQTGHKLIVSGSGSLELKADIVEPMTGRKRVFYCLPLSFNEYCANYFGVPFDKVEEYLDINKSDRSDLIDQYIAFGGYPRVILETTEKNKFDVLNEIYTSYVEKDIQLILGIENDYVFQNLLKLLSNQVGNLVNLSELATNLRSTVKTISKYLYFLEKTFLIKLVRPFYTNARLEVIKNPKVFFVDLGILSLAKGRIPDTKTVLGSTFENACYLRLSELMQFEPIKYWRTTSSAEVDFVLNSTKGEKIPVEVKLSAKKGSAGKNVISFIKKYKSPKAFIYTKEDEAVFEKVGVKVEILPYYKLPQI